MHIGHEDGDFEDMAEVRSGLLENDPQILNRLPSLLLRVFREGERPGNEALHSRDVHNSIVDVGMRVNGQWLLKPFTGYGNAFFCVRHVA